MTATSALETETCSLLAPASFWTPEYLVDSAWLEHAPFAFWLMSVLRPKTIVELGTHHGYSYFAFCQAVGRLGTPTQCYAVDNWRGDEHSGYYAEDVYSKVETHNRTHYNAFSRLVRSSFDEALEHFPDGSIDLLHIDGRHFYDDVKHDFECWKPKLSPQAVVLFHDTNVRERDFGVFRYWDELTRDYPHFNFSHGHGLGVLGYGKNLPRELRRLFDLDASSSSDVRDFYSRLGVSLTERQILNAGRQKIGELEGTVEHLLLTRNENAREIANSAAQIAALNSVLGERDTKASELLVVIDKHEADAIDLKRQLGVEQARLLQLSANLAERDKVAHQLQETCTALEKQLTEQHSNSVILTARLAERNADLRRLEKRPLQRLNRWFQKIAWGVGTTGIKLQPIRAAERLSGLGPAVWRFSDGDPQFLLDWGTRPLPAGYYVLEGTGRNVEACHRPLLYVDTGDGFTEAGALPINLRPNGKERWRAKFKLPKGIRHLRFDPSVRPGEIELDGLTLRRRFLKKNSGMAAPNPLVQVSEASAPPRPAAIAVRTAPLVYKPLISVIMPVYNVDPPWLERAIELVKAQTYENWELCICNDCSTRQETVAALRQLEGSDPRIRVTHLETNGGISRATNAALDIGRGEFVAFLDNDDEITPDALETYVSLLNDDPSVDVFYSDEDKINASGSFEEPFFKPAWSPSFLREVMYVGHFLMTRRSLAEQVGRLDSNFDGVQDFEFMLRLGEQTSRIRHVPKILYHWRRIPGSVAFETEAKPGLGVLQERAVNAHLKRRNIAARCVANANLLHRTIVIPQERKTFPRISIIVPTKDAPEHISRCLNSIYQKTLYPNFEVVVVDNGTTDPAAVAALKGHPIKHVKFDEPFNYSRANNLGVQESTGEVLVLLNNDTEVLAADWLDQMMFLLDEPDVGAVGPMLVYPDNKVQHAGVAVGIRGTADHVLRGLDCNDDGYFGSLNCTREVTAVTFACAMLRKSRYLELGGLQEYYATHYQDVDFCLRLRQLGLRNLYTPRTKLVHYESATRGGSYDHLDRALLIDCWSTEISKGDEFSRWEPAARAGAGGS